MHIPYLWKVRVYYEDTDAAGVVFYANYLRYMERARTEWLRSLGFGHKILEREYKILFVVKNLAIDYIKPARLDDMLTVTSQLATLRKASMVFKQKINNEDGELLINAEIKIACLDSTSLKVSSIPNNLLTEFSKKNG